MKGLLGVTCLCWLLLGYAGLSVQTLVSSAGHTITYEVESTVLAGIPELDDQYSGLSIRYILKVDVASKSKAIFSIHDVRTGKLNDKVPVSYEEDIEIQHTPSPHYERELSRPFAAHFDDNQLTKFVAPEPDSVWAVNFKKAIVEKFQVDLKKQSPPAGHVGSNQIPRIDPEASIFSVYEDGIGGECETLYSVLSVPSLDYPDQSEDVLNVTKVKNYRNCRSRPVFGTDNFELQGSPIPYEPKVSPQPKSKTAIWREAISAYESGYQFGFQPEDHPVKSYSIVWYNISRASHNPVIEGILAEGKTSYSLYGKEILVVAQMNASLVRKTGLRSEVPKISQPVQYESLEYQLPDEELDVYSVLGPIHTKEVQQAVLRMLEDLVNEIIPSEPETSKGAGTNVLQIVNALSVLKRPELEEIYQELESDKIEKVPKKQEMIRKLFLDIVAIVATDEAALFARDLITVKRVSVSEAVELVEGIGKNSDEPSDEVIQAYLELLDRPRVQQSRPLLAATAIAVANMIEDACVQEDSPVPPQQVKKQPGHQGQPRHPRSIKSFVSSEEDSQEYSPKKPHKSQRQDDDECSPQELEEYIKIISQKLQNAKSFNRILIYIETLARMGTAKVLPYLTPYVTGEAPNADALDDEDTDFLATNALYALHHIAENDPDEVLPIVTSIYFDPSEDYDQRIAAFSVLLASDPPLNLLERIATELHTEINNQVGSYVYSLLSDLANSTLPKDRKMAQKIQLVLPHAPDFDIGVQYSNSYKYTFYDDDDDYGINADHEYVASNVSAIPRAFYTALDLIKGPFEDSVLELGGTMKGVDELLDKLFEPSGVLSQILSHLGSTVQVKNIPQVLDILKDRCRFTNQDSDIPRAVLYYKLFGRTTYLTLDEQYVVELLERAVQFFRQMDTTSGMTAHYVKVWMPASFIRAVPSAVGLPVVVSHRNPIILSVSLSNARVSSNQQKQAPLTSTVAASADFDISLHMDNIALAYFVDPVSDQVHGAAFEKTTEISWSKELEIAVDLAKQTAALKVKLNLPSEIFYHNTRPVTFIGEATPIRMPKEEWLGHVNEIETIPEPFKFDERYEARPLGLTLRVAGDSENPWADIPLPLTATANEDGIVAAFLEMAVNPEMINRELHVYLEPHHKNPASELVFTLDYDQHIKFGLPKHERSQEQSQESEEDEEEYEKAVSSIYGRSYSVPDAQSTVEKLVKKTQATWAPVLGQGYSDPVPATVTHVLDMTMAVKGARTKHHALRLLYAHSLGFRSNWFQAVGHSSGDERDRPSQFCSSLVAVYPEMPNPFYLQKNTLKSQRAKIEGEIGWGTGCQHQSQILIKGTMEKSEQQLSSSSGVYETEKDQQSLPWYYKQCQVDKTEGQTQSYACQQAIAEDSQLNLIKLDFIAPHLPREFLNLTYKADQLFKYLWYPNMEIDPFASNPEDRVSVELHYSQQVPAIPLIDIEIQKPSETVVYSKLYIPIYEPPTTLDFYQETFMDQFYDDDYTPECNLMEDYLQTFDNVTIELPDNHCQYILAHDSSPDKAYTIIASQIDLEAKTKALSMVLAEHTVKILPPRGEEVPIVLDGKERSVTPSKPIVLDFNKPSELRIFVRLTSASTETPILVIRAPDDDITIKYDGKNALIKLPRGFQGDQVGLCGDFNDEQFQEFTGPHGCTFVDEEDFANSYAIPGQSCPKPPRPQGPAFCPPDVHYKEQKKSELQDKSDEDQPQHPRPPRRPYYPEDDDEEQPKPHHPKVPSHRRPQSSSEEDQKARKPNHQGHPNPQWASQESEEDDKPSGPAACIKEYTATFEDEDGKTCFATQPVYKCRSECRPVRSQPKRVPFHCMPPSKYEKVLKDQARHGLVTQIQNKPAEKTRSIQIPEKCLPDNA